MLTLHKLLFLVTIVGVFTYYYLILRLVTHPKKPAQISLIDKHDRNYLWGTYRGNLYFGMRTKSPESLLTGLLWFGIEDFEGAHSIRHSCEITDNLGQWGWIEHDGKSYGKQIITDHANNCILTTKFVKDPESNGGEWIASVSGEPINPAVPMRISVIYYSGYNFDGSPLVVENGKKIATVKGYLPETGNFTLVFDKNPSTRLLARKIDPKFLWNIKNSIVANIIYNARIVLSNSRGMSKFDQIFLVDAGIMSNSNFVSLQHTFDQPFTIQVGLFQGSGDNLDKNAALNREELFEQQSNLFHTKYDRKFPCSDNDTTFSQIGKAALSNLLGGISYFHGSALVYDWTGTEKVVAETEEFQLFTDIPSRPTFPRGFLWDTGFHNLVISKWDRQLSLDILSSWIDRVDKNGWIAREQIPGEEARSKVPENYRVQNPRFANPPALLLSLYSIADATLHEMQTLPSEENARSLETLRAIYSGYRKNLQWYLHTQKGKIHPQGFESLKTVVLPNDIQKLPSFRWRGRSKHHTLTSGLDDYPRGDVPNPFELHVDLVSWISFASKTMLKLMQVLGMENTKEKRIYYELYKNCLVVLEGLHWDQERKCYGDRTIDQDGNYVFVPNKGYVSIFPLLFGLVDKDSPRLGELLDLLEDPEELWSDFGIRSLSKADPFYMKADQYWTGPIWININYLILASLKTNYVNVAGPFQTQAEQVYTRLRQNIMKNMALQYEKTGFIWEQYSDVDGQGMRSHPFTGWSSLIVLIISEQY